MDAHTFFVHVERMISQPIEGHEGHEGNEASPSPDTAHLSPLSHTQRVYRELRRLIIAGDIEPGRKLKISELRERLDAGGTPVREALSLLTSDQLVERIDQRGFRTAPVSQAHFLELLQLRCQLESIALRASITLGTAAWESDLTTALDALADMDPSIRDSWEVTHKRFHQALISACNSPMLLRFCDQLYDLNIRYRNLAARATRLGIRDVDAEHRLLVETALARDTDIACNALSAHYTRTGDYLTERLARLS